VFDEGNVFDCASECGGNAVTDECGLCGGPGAIYECGCDDLTNMENNVLTLTNLSEDSLHYEFTYTLGELTFQDLQHAERSITALRISCLETGEIWVFDSDGLSSGNSNHANVMDRYENFTPSENRNMDGGTLIGYDDDNSGNYHFLSFDVRDEILGNSVYQELDWYPLSWEWNDISFPNLEFSVGDAHDPDDYKILGNSGELEIDENISSIENELFSVGVAGEICDCNGNILDECGICGGDGIDECGICGGNGICIPDEFEFVESSEQAFYLFSLVTIDETVVDSNDWVGAFNGNQGK
jgi:hypothetical protein